MKLLFVCHGNICRSPTVHGVFEALVAREAPGLVQRVDSAGTADHHVGEPPDPRSCRVAAARGYDLSGLRARQVRREDFQHFDLLLAMDGANLAALHALGSPLQRQRAHLFLEFAGHPSAREVPDPYFGGEDGFLQVLDLCEAASRRLIARLRDQAC